jgi:hypothetical protein
LAGHFQGEKIKNKYRESKRRGENIDNAMDKSCYNDKEKGL